MRRIELPEIHDHPAFPGFLRDHVTDVLETLWNSTGTYRPILSRLKSALEQADTHSVLDLCSGGGGPWLSLGRELREAYGYRVDVSLSDRYPNQQAFTRASEASSGNIRFETLPVDATSVPHHLKGFRTIFSSFHHFAPPYARAILRDAALNGRGIAIFEVAQRRLITVLMIFAMPLLVLALVPFMRPFRWQRLFWTYLVPVIPFVLWFDGLVSCLRSYSRVELEELAQSESAEDYTWRVGLAGTGRLRVTYLIGCPLIPTLRESALIHNAESALEAEGVH